MAQQVKSRQRVQDHGEVFTNEREANTMLDMVKAETKRLNEPSKRVVVIHDRSISTLTRQEQIWHLAAMC